MTQRYLPISWQKHTTRWLLWKDGKRSIFDHNKQVIKLRIVGADLNDLIKEAGGHRIQRVPPTERKGRVHTSSVTVAVIDPSEQKHDSKLSLIGDEHFKVDWFSGTGKGGQHRNKKMCSCRVTHIPTGVTEVRQGRSREANQSDATSAIIQKLESMKNTQNHKHRSSVVRDMIGSGMRGDKIRTYRFQDDSVIDHNSNKQATCKMVMKGNFRLLW